jgi:putative ABC transport system permease protein
MNTLWAASARHLLQRPAQLVLALVGLALGVAAMTSIGLTTATARRAFELSLDAVNGAATHQLSAGPRGVPESLYVELRRSWPTDVAPVIDGYAVTSGQSVLLLGIDPFADPRFRDYSVLQANGGLDLLSHWLTEPGAVTMSARTAQTLGLAVGQEFALDIAGHAHPARLIGLIHEDRAGLDNLVFTDIAQAQEWLGMAGRLSRIDVRVPEGDPGTRRLEELRARLLPGIGLSETARRNRESADLTHAFMTNLRAMSLLALLVGGFLIFNSMGFALLLRRRTLGVLRALGATRGQVLALVMSEALVLGVIGAVSGALSGLWLARQLLASVTRTINDLYFVVSVREVDPEPLTLIAAIMLGIGVAGLATFVPALEAARTEPQLALRRSALEHRSRRTARGLAVAGALLIALGLGLVSLSRRSLAAGFVALLLLLLSAAFLTPATLRAVAQLSARVAGRVSAGARLAFGDVAASLSRTGIAVGALSIAVSAAIGVALMVASFRESLAEWLARTLRADIYVTAHGPGFSRPERLIEPEVIRTLLASPGVREASAIRRVAVESSVGTVLLDALQPAGASYGGIALIAGDGENVWPAFARGDVLLSEPFAFRHALAVGDSIELATANGSRRFRIAGIYRDYGTDRGAVLMHREVYRQDWGDDGVTSLGLYVAAGAQPADVIAALRATTSDDQALLMRSNRDLRALSMQIFERTFAITRVLYWLAAAVAAIGLLSALLAYEIERARELALLRALGMTPAGIAALVETQTTFLGIAAALTAIPTGTMAALVLIEVINRRAFGWHIDFHWSTGEVAQTLALALGAALLAGLYPAWRSSRVAIAASMREE